MASLNVSQSLAAIPFSINKGTLNAFMDINEAKEVKYVLFNDALNTFYLRVTW